MCDARARAWCGVVRVRVRACVRCVRACVRCVRRVGVVCARGVCAPRCVRCRARGVVCVRARGVCARACARVVCV